MKIKNEKPPIWASVRTLLDFDEKTTIFTYGDTIYNPANLNITPDLIVHESVHEIQQKGILGPPRWWKKYLHNQQFRFEQELEAYRAQYAYYRGVVKDRNRLVTHLRQLAVALTGPMYGNLPVGLFEAMRLIKNETHNH